MNKGILVLFFVLFAADVVGNDVDSSARRLKSSLGLHLNVSYRNLIAPVEGGVSYNRFLKNDYYWVLNYRVASASSKNTPLDYETYGSGFLNTKKSSANFTEIMHTFNFRVGRTIPIYKNWKWMVEMGPTYAIYNAIEVHPLTVFQSSNYVTESKRYDLLGLSIRNALNLFDSRKVRLDVFVYNQINTRFSYTSVGLQFGLKQYYKIK